jgi:serum/glucocorticoid-regulated kinase 2
MDYCAGGELFYHLRKVKRMSEEEARFYFIEILAGIQYLHENSILYRDLKPENLLINIDGHIKITDFGLSKPDVGRDDLAYTFCGSAEYMPPEMILNAGHNFTVDYYTLGALLYELVCGLPPFYSKDHEEIKRAIVEEELYFPEDIDLSPEIMQILRGLLHKNPRSRLGSYSGIKEILYHPWIGKVHMAEVLAKRMDPPFLPSPEEFNFDKDEMGSDEQEFTAALLAEQKKAVPFKPLFQDFYYEEDDPAVKRTQQLLLDLKLSESKGTSLRKMKSPYL